ncbi:MAG: 50S ribosomal protein L3, partial [candidate division NC10 bacterium]
FAGVMKRHGFKGFAATHGTHESKRGGGSIGQSADPAKVFKNMKMPGQMGDEAATVQNLRIVDIREDQNLLMIKGPVPGAKNGLLIISHAIKKEAPPLREIETTPEESDTEPALSPAESGIEGEILTEELSSEEQNETPAEAPPEATEDKPVEEETEAASPSADLSAEAEEAKVEASEDKPAEEAVEATEEAAEETAQEEGEETTPETTEEADEEKKV